jgi:flagellar protein FliS
MPQNQANQYRSVELETKVSAASPHQLISMLFEGGVERLNQAKSAVQRGDLAAKGVFLGKALSIVSGLRESLNMEVDSEIPQNLDRLYEYIQFRLVKANVDADESAYDEVIGLIKTIQSGWESIPQTP